MDCAFAQRARSGGGGGSIQGGCVTVRETTVPERRLVYRACVDGQTNGAIILKISRAFYNLAGVFLSEHTVGTGSGRAFTESLSTINVRQTSTGIILIETRGKDSNDCPRTNHRKLFRFLYEDPAKHLSPHPRFSLVRDDPVRQQPNCEGGSDRTADKDETEENDYQEGRRAGVPGRAALSAYCRYDFYRRTMPFVGVQLYHHQLAEYEDDVYRTHLHDIVVPNGGCRSVAIHPDWEFGVAGDTVGYIHTYDINTGLVFGEPIRPLDAGRPLRMVRSLKFSPDGQYLAAMIYQGDISDNSLIIFAVEHNKEGQAVLRRLGAQRIASYPSAIAWTRDSNSVLIAAVGIMRYQSDEQGQWRLTRTYPIPSRHSATGGWAYKLRVSDGEGSLNEIYFTGSQVQGILDLESGGVIITTGHGGRVTAAVYTPDGASVVTSSIDGTVEILDAENWQVRRTIGICSGLCGGLYGVDVSKDGSQIVIAGENYGYHGRLWVMDARTGERLGAYSSTATADISRPTMLSLQFSPDYQMLATSGTGGTVELWDTTTWRVIHRFQAHDPVEAVNIVRWSDDGRYLATGSDDRTVRVWDMENPDAPPRVLPHSGPVKALAWAPGTHNLVTAAGQDLMRWDAATGQRIGSLIGHAEDISSLVYAADGTLVSASLSGSVVHFWGNNHMLTRRVPSNEWGDFNPSAIAVGPDACDVTLGFGSGTVTAHSELLCPEK